MFQGSLDAHDHKVLIKEDAKPNRSSDWSPPYPKDPIILFAVAGLGLFLHSFMSTEQSGWKSQI